MSFAKLETRQTTGQQERPFPMANLQRRYGNQHRIDRIVDPLALEGMVDKFSPTAEELCNYGTIDDMAAEILSGILLVMKQNTTLHPVDVAFFGTDAHVFEAKDLPHLIE